MSSTTTPADTETRNTTRLGAHVRGVNQDGATVTGIVIGADSDTIAVLPGNIDLPVFITRESAEPATTDSTLEPSEVTARTFAALRAYEKRIAQSIKWRNEVAAAARDMADDQNLCGVFDEFMEEWGLGGRSRSWNARVRVTFEMEVSTEGRNEEDARNALSQSDVDDAAISFIRENLSREHWEIEHVSLD